MWLGFAAAFIGIFYALGKFLTALQIRRLREDLLQGQHEVQKRQQRLEGLAERLGLQQSKKRALQREVEELRHLTEKLYTRLQAVLPPTLLPQLEECRTLHAEPSSEELKLLRELALVDEINRALTPLSLLLVHLSEEQEVESVLAIAHLTQLLSDAGVHFQGPRQGVFISFFPHPAAAVNLMRRFLQEEPNQRAATLRAGLQAGIEITGEADEVHCLLARHLLRARKLLEQAPAGTLLMNAEAYRTLEDRQGIELFDATAQVYALTWNPLPVAEEVRA